MKRFVKAYLINSSIRRKLTSLVMLTCGVVLLSTTVVFTVKEAVSLIGEQNRNLTSLADILSKNVTSALIFNDPQSALETMNSLSVKTDILAAYILNNDGTIFCSYTARGAKPASLPLPQLLPGAIPHGTPNAVTHISLRLNQLWHGPDQVNLTRPIVLDGKIVGTVGLIADLSKLRAHLLSTMLVTLIILGLAAIATYFLSLRLQEIISEPILHLSDAMRRVSESKDFSLRVVKPGNDEIGSLYDGFNEMLHEIEERNLVLQQRQEHLQELAHFDILTRLPNRALFRDRLKQAMNLALRNDQQVAVLFLDLDRFKDINDTLGHSIGDMLLQQVADRMELVMRDCDTVARLGGDEFTIFVQDIKSAENACKVAQKLLDLFEIPYCLAGQQIYISNSIGITLFPADSNNIDGLLMNADIAMYRAKADGKNTYRLYNSEMSKQGTDRVALQSDLRSAVDLKQLRLLYQPKFDTLSGRIVGVEALIRWQHPERGLIPPDLFIPLAEESGSIFAITEWVLNTACHQAKLWHDAGYAGVTMAVNISAVSLKRKNVVAMVEQALANTGLPPDLLELELTESMLIDNNLMAEETLRVLKDLGISIAIDDFGTGYSSLSYLHRFPIDSLKIDRSFVWNMNRSSNDLAIVVAIIAMAHSFKLQVIAEGVETEEQLETLKTCGCEVIQGYLLSKPVGAEEVNALLMVG